MNLADINVTRMIPRPPRRSSTSGSIPRAQVDLGLGARVILNAVVDGLFYLAVKHEGRIWPHYGRFLQIDRPRRVEHTWVSEATKGVETVVAITLEPKGDHTEMTLRHSGLADDEMGRGTKRVGPGVSPCSPISSRRANPLHERLFDCKRGPPLGPRRRRESQDGESFREVPQILEPTASPDSTSDRCSGRSASV